MGKELIQFARNEKGKPIGCFVGLSKDAIGWSLCNKKDKWDRQRAVDIAYGRALVGSFKSVPQSIKKQYDKFRERCNKYYKD